jgi:2-polyprenyl-3-methyl-5-hydroxy-6-metoxy-1,4-benzoquinol methylase
MKRIESHLEALFLEVDRAVLALIESIEPEDLSSHYDLASRRDGIKATPGEIFELFIGGERNRFIRAVDIIRTQQSTGSVCDLGCFLPYLPLVLRKLGFSVTIVDNYHLFGESLRHAILNFASENDIQVVDLDIVSDNFSQLGKYDVVLLMAVVEHLHGSPRELLLKIHDITAHNGFLLFEVPNIAELGKRITFLFGRSPLPEYALYFLSGYPFRGHSREMTMSEVTYLLKHTGFEIVTSSCYDYWTPTNSRVLGQVFELTKRLLPIKNKHQSIMAVARPCVSSS